MKASVFVAGMMALGVASATRVDAAEIKVLSAGAYKSVAITVQPDFEKQSGHKLVIDNDTVGGIVKPIEGGEAFNARRCR
jgi:molybdate transport system substrate-binding protein